MLSYHRRLRMVSEAPEQRVEGEELVRIGACVLLVMAMVGLVDGMLAGQSQRVVRMLGAARALPKCEATH